MIQNLINKLKQYSEDLQQGKYIAKVCMDNEDFITDLNANKQLFEEGENALGVKIDSYMPYSQVTIAIKHQKGQPVNRVTLRDTGAFEKSFIIHCDSKQIIIFARDPKTKKLSKKYGAEIFGLTSENKNLLIWSKIYPYLKNELLKLLNYDRKNSN